MSWDIVVFNLSESVSSVEDIDENKLIETDFHTVFEKKFDTIFANDNHREIKGNNFSIDYFFDNKASSNIMLSLYGQDAIYPIIDLAIKNNWQIFDTGMGEMIDLNNPSKNGYDNFQAYLTQILNNK